MRATKKVCVRIAIFACTDRLRVCELRFCEYVCCRITAASLAQLVYSTFIRIPRPLFAPSVPNMAQTGVAGIRWPPSEACRRKNAIEQNGQPVVLRVACLGELFAIALEPGRASFTWYRITRHASRRMVRTTSVYARLVSSLVRMWPS